MKSKKTEDLLKNHAHEVTLVPGYLGYANPRVTDTIDTLFPGELTHLKFTPLVDEACIIVQAAAKGETGAVEMARGDSRRTAQFNLWVALNSFDLDWSDDRKLKLPAQGENVPVGKEKRSVLLLRVKRAAGRTRVTRKTTTAPAVRGAQKKKDAPAAQSANQVAAAKPESDVAE